MKNNDNHKLGIALSGGGFRATIYHLGTFNKLNELGLLNKVNVISSNSGGSITAACYSLYHDDFEVFSKILKNGVKKEITFSIFISPFFLFPIALLILLFSAQYWFPFLIPSYIFSIISIISFFILIRFQFYLIPISRIIEKKYDKFFFKNCKLKDLSKDFKTTINSTNTETGRIFYFSREKMEDSTYSFKHNITFKHEDFPIARAVIASSCVPFAFSPILIKKQFFINKNDYKKIKPKLVDGGVYDNQGIHKLTFFKSSSYCKNIIVSDAGNFLPYKSWTFNTLFLMIRTSELFMSRIKNIQMMNNLYTKNNNSIIAYQSLGFNLEDSIDEFINMLRDGFIDEVVIISHKISKEEIENKDWDSIKKHLKIKVDFDKIKENGCNDKELKIARNVKTGLSKLNDKKINALIKHAEAITEIQVKLFLPHLINEL